MERLRQKGYLARRKDGRAFRYSPRVAPADLMRGLGHEFVEMTLGGSLSPFVAYLAEAKDLTASEVEELRRLLDELPPEQAG